MLNKEDFILSGFQTMDNKINVKFHKTKNYKLVAVKMGFNNEVYFKIDILDIENLKFVLTDIQSKIKEDYFKDEVVGDFHITKSKLNYSEGSGDFLITYVENDIFQVSISSVNTESCYFTIKKDIISDLLVVLEKILEFI